MVRRKCVLVKSNNKIKTNIGDKIYVSIVYVVLAVIAIAALYPFLNIVMVSISGAEYVSRGEVTIWPKGVNLDAYKSVLESPSIFIGYKNTLFVTLLTTILGVLTTALTAYPLSKETLPGKKGLLIFVSITMWFHAGMIPRFLVMKNLDLLDSLVGLSLACMLSGYNVVVMRNFFMGLPKALEESAQLDGCNDLQILFKIILPLSLSSIATIALWIAVSAWNAFFEPMLFLNTSSKYTLQIFLRDIVVNSTLASNDMDMEMGAVTSDMVRYATIMVATIPILLVYPFIQKYFVQGVTVGAVKG